MIFRTVLLSLSLVLAFLSLACTSRPNQPSTEITSSSSSSAPVAAAEEVPLHAPRFAVIPESARPGDPITVAYSDTFAWQPEKAQNLTVQLLSSSGKVLSKANFFSPGWHDRNHGEIKTALFSVPSTAVRGSASIRIQSDHGIIRDLPFIIEGRDFQSETIPLNQANTDLRTAPNPERVAESQRLWAILAHTGTEIFSDGAFLPPVTSTRLTSFFGSRRVFQYSGGGSDTSIHAGIDYGVPTGTPVTAPARARVILARPRIVTGNSIILEHLPGVYSLYYHLDTLSVAEGAIVERGQTIAHSGNTGLSTGAHLHWELRVSTENSDPHAFLARSILDKNDILDTLKE